jgi:hypothetical protein
MSEPPIATGGRAVNPAIAELASLDRWVVWKTERRRAKDGRIKETKPPYCIGGRRRAKSTDPATWDSFDLCWSSAFVDRAAQGVGFVLGAGFIGCDLDDCVENGVVKAWALDVVQRLNSYTEVSPTGTGLHIICRGEMAGPGRVVGDLEVYPSDRYFTMTGRHLAGTPTIINPVAQSVLEELLARANGVDQDQPDDAFDALPEDLRIRFNEACAWDAALEARWDGEPPGGQDQTRSAWDLSLAGLLRRHGGFSFEDFVALAGVWEYGTGADGDMRQRRRAWAKAGEDSAAEAEPPPRRDTDWPDPDLTALSDDGLPPPELPLAVFGPWWTDWIRDQAQAKSCAPDYVAAGLLASAGALIGNARWGAPWTGWAEPAVIWTACVGNPSAGKSPGLDASLEVLCAIEADANADYPERLDEWKTAITLAKITRDIWEADCKAEIKKGFAAPDKPEAAEPPQRPTMRRIITNDPTIEKVARLVLANPKGLLLFRDELAGWIGALDKYGGAGGDRAFYIEAYGARRYAVDRVKDSEPVVVQALAVSIAGGIQPDRLHSLVLCGDDDGLAARFLYVWPRRALPERPRQGPPEGAKERLLLLYGLDDHSSTVIPFTGAAAVAIQTYRKEVAAIEASAAGLFLSWLGKLPGMAVRLAVVLEHLYWCSAQQTGSAPPAMISERAAIAAITLLDDYAVPMARRCFGEASLPQVDRDSVALARWIAAQEELPPVVNARDLRKASVLSTKDAGRYDAALIELGEAGWLRPSPARARTSAGRRRKDWAVNPKLKGRLS